MNEPVTRRKGLRVWTADLLMGLRFAVAGGRSGWVRAGLTALGVALGVVMLLGAASLPTTIQNIDDRNFSVVPQYSDAAPEPGDVLIASEDSMFRDSFIQGLELQPYKTDDPAIPTGLDAFPAPGEAYVSPALADLLDSEEGELLKPRFAQYEIVGVIDEEGVLGAGELRFYAGGDGLTATNAQAIKGFGIDGWAPSPVPVVMILLIIVAITIMLLPVVMFVAVAARFGGERRDRRLAALRLVGADGPTVRRMAAGESLLGALAGLLLGAALYVVAAQLLANSGFLEYLSSGQATLYASDIEPDPLLAILVVASIPLVAIVATQLSMRRLIVEPLGVVRDAKPRRRRLWWRLALVVLGVAGLLPAMTGASLELTGLPVVALIGGMLSLLLGMAAILPWLVETVVSRARGGAPSWQLAIRRLQLGGGGAARAIIGVAVAVAGAVAMQMLFTTVAAHQPDEGENPGFAADEADIRGNGASADIGELTDSVEKIPGVEVTRQSSSIYAIGGEGDYYTVLVADCEDLRVFAEIGGCRDGDAFTPKNGYNPVPRGGETVVFEQWTPWGEDKVGEQKWTVPEIRDKVRVNGFPELESVNLLVTPGAVASMEPPGGTQSLIVQFDAQDPDSLELLRNVAATQDGEWSVSSQGSVQEDSFFAKLRIGLFMGVVATMILIGLSMLVNTLEQLQERRRLMSVLVAFGARRRSLILSVLWQTAIPVVTGMLLATVTGLAMGRMLVAMSDEQATMDWAGIATINGAGVAMVLIVTLLSLPALWRMMRPDGIRTE